MGAAVIEDERGTLICEEVASGPWTDGSTATFQPWTDGWAVGYRFVVNGVVSYVLLNPSGGGDSPDVFLYRTEDVTGDEDHPRFDPVLSGLCECFITPAGVGMSPEEAIANQGRE